MTNRKQKVIDNWLSVTHNTIIKLLYILGACLLFLSLTGCGEHSLGLLNPKGIVTYKERKLFFDSMALMLIVVLPVIIMSFAFAYHYKASHRIKDYKPNWSHSYLLEGLWWGIPCVIIVVLAVLTWKRTIELDPYQPIAGHPEKPLLIQAIALPWKWLFIYPQQGIATVNYVVIPTGQQVEFWITADNVAMSSFFIPQLGSQIYAMAGMRTRLHLASRQVGVYDGMNTQFNGPGFSYMHFAVNVVEPTKMDAWVAASKKAPLPLNEAAYSQLLNPSINDQPKTYSPIMPDLFQNTLSMYMDTNGTTHPRENQLKYHFSER